MKSDHGAEGVRHTLAEYCHSIDSGEADRWADLFASDAELVVDEIGALQDRINIRTFVVGSLEALRANGIAGINHQTMNSLITIDGDRARTTSDFALVVLVDGVFSTAALGRYLDAFTYRDDRWLFTQRRITWFQGSAPEHIVATLSPVFSTQPA